MSDDQRRASDLPAPGGPEATAAAKEILIRFLTGEDYDSAGMRAALRLLIQQSPVVLDDLRLVFEGEHYDAIWQEFSEVLTGYLALDDEAALHMPEVQRFVEAYSHVKYFLEQARQQETAWKDLARQIRQAEAESMQEAIPTVTAEASQKTGMASETAATSSVALVLGKQGWMWVFEGSDAKKHEERRLRSEEIEQGVKIGAFSLCSVPRTVQRGMQFNDVAEPPIGLSLPLSNEAAVVIVVVIPKYQEIERIGRRTIWHLRCELDPSSEAKISPLFVGYGTQDRQQTGKRQLKIDRPVTFTLDPPPRENVWLHFKWRDNDEWTYFKTALQLRLASTEDLVTPTPTGPASAPRLAQADKRMPGDNNNP